MRKFLKKLMKNVLTYIVPLVLVGVTFGAFVRTSRSSYDVIAKRILFTSDGTASGSNVLDVNDGGSIVAYGPLTDGGGNNFLTGVNGIEVDPIWNSESGNYLLVSQSGDYYALNPQGFLTGGQIAGAETDPVWIASSGDYYLVTNPDGYITGYSETDPNFEANSGDYYTLNPLGYITGGEVSGAYVPLSFADNVIVDGNNHRFKMDGIIGLNIGNENNNTGDFSTTIGYQNDADGLGTTSIGYINATKGTGGVSIGYFNASTGTGSNTVIGNNLYSNDVIDSILLGYSSFIFFGDKLLSLGFFNSSFRSNVIGSYNNVGTGSTVIGKNFVVGLDNEVGLSGSDSYNYLFGAFNQLNGGSNNLLGISNNISGIVNYILGTQNDVEGDFNMILGIDNDLTAGIDKNNRNKVFGNDNDIYGSSNGVLGSYNYATFTSDWNNIIGNFNYTQSDYNFIIGRYNTGLVNNVYMMGYGLVGRAGYGLNVGKYNVGHVTSLFEVGGGLGVGSEKNMLTVWDVGGVQISDSNVLCDATKYGTIQFSGDNFYGCKTSGWVLLN